MRSMPRSNCARTRFRAFTVVALCMVMAATTFGQSTNSADLRGTVTDSTGAVMPGVKVTILNTETGITMDLTTNDAGLYDSVSIRPGKYRLTFSKEGFSKLIRDGVTVDVALFETVQEVQINTSTFSAQYGIGGAVFNQISKGGTNQLHGAGYEYLRNNFFNSRNTFSPSVSLSRWDNFGGSIGGPVIKNKMFAYFNIDKIIN